MRLSLGSFPLRSTATWRMQRPCRSSYSLHSQGLNFTAVGALMDLAFSVSVNVKIAEVRAMR